MRIHHRRLPRFFIHGKPIQGVLPRLLLFLSAILFVLIACGHKLKPVVREYAYNQAVHIAANTVNNAVNDVLAENEIVYDDLVSLLTDEDGNVAALKTNALKINQLKAEIVGSVMKKLDGLEGTKIKIPVFSALGLHVFSRLSPKLTVYIEPIGSASASFGSEFSDAGINQTAHRIIMNITANITVIMPHSNISADIDSDIDIAETIIVGVVPESYSNTSS